MTYWLNIHSIVWLLIITMTQYHPYLLLCVNY